MRAERATDTTRPHLRRGRAASECGGGGRGIVTDAKREAAPPGLLFKTALALPYGRSPQGAPRTARLAAEHGRQEIRVLQRGAPSATERSESRDI